MMDPDGSNAPPERTDLTVIGLGYVGLPVLVGATMAGLRVTGLDVDETIVDGLTAGCSHVGDVSGSVLVAIRRAGATFTTNDACLRRTKAIIVCVPTPLDEQMQPDMRFVRSAADSIARNLQPETLVVLESTTYPGTTEGEFREALETSGLKAGVDFHLAYSPERIDPGNTTYGLCNTPKVVGGFTPDCTRAATALYKHFVDDVVPVSGTREAELTKLLENTYRHVNIALVNEMLVFCSELGIDLREAIGAASTKPFGFQPFYPGPGVGGHCIPIDPSYLSYSVRTLGYQFRFVELAQEVNHRMPTFVVTRVQARLNCARQSVNGARIVVVGLGYKEGVADVRSTPSRPVVDQLCALGADIVLSDPFVREFGCAAGVLPVEPDSARAIAGSDLVLLMHSASDENRRAIEDARIPVIDCRGSLPTSLWVEHL